MRLQADPPVQYALPGEPRRLFNKDYDYDSPYNTYRHSGLPPGPINSPGRASIVAALFPADVDYLYFVATGEGGHVFTHSLQEHAAAKKRTAAARKNTWQKKKLVTGD
ncbi:MAG: endolytic transglycosylase MltG, partial [Gemmatimonadetes bacterium]|nr:endolytic transglycosylase MltG [Gemmatimonadota bacterium]